MGKTMPTPEKGKTIPVEPEVVIAKLVLPDNREIEIKKVEKVFGRVDFKGIVSDEKLRHISREHFKITKENEEIYIEDLNSLGGTMLNDEEIKGLGRVKLRDGDDILIAKVLRVRYEFPIL